MKLNIKIISYPDYGNAVIIQSENNRLEFSDGEPEDNNLYRNFSDVYSIEKLVKEAYNAGKNCEELNVVTEKIKLDE